MNFWMGKAQSKHVSVYDGAIFLCNRLTRRECFERKLFGLASQYADFIQKVKSGATLFLYEVEQHKLHGVFEATSDGAMDIIPDAFISSRIPYPSQIRFKRIWFCKPLMESEFQDALQANYFSRNRFSFGLSHQQVVKLLHLFSSRNRLQPRQNPRLQDEVPRESEISSLINQTDNQSSSNSGSHGSFKSPCQTCTSSTLGQHEASLSHKLTESMSSMHRELQPDFSDAAKSNSSKSSLHTVANTDLVTGPCSEEAIDDKFTDDYIPLQLEEDTLESVDDLSDLLEDESHSSESKGSSGSEDPTTFHQPCDTKKDDFHPPVVNSKLRSDNEGRTSVFSRLMGRPTAFSRRNKSNTKAFPSMNAKSFAPLHQRKKQRRIQRNKPFPCDDNRMVDMLSANRMSRIPLLDNSFVWDYSGRSNGFSVGKPSKIQTHLGPFLREDVNKWDASTKEPDRYDACKKLFVPEDSGKLIGPCDRELNVPPVFAEIHESSELAVKEETRTPFLDFKRRAKDPTVEGDQVSDNDDIEEAARKKIRLASASYHQEYQSDTALVPKGTKAMDVQAISDGSCKHKSINLSSKDTFTQMANAYLETKVLLQDEQQENIQGCCEEVTADKSLSLEDSETMDLMPKLSFGNRQTSNVETRGEVASGHVETEKSLQEKQNQSLRSCHGVVNTDKLLLENSETMDFLPNHDEGCGSKMCLSSDGYHRHVASSHLVVEMPLQEKQTPSVQSCSQVVRGDNVLVPENSEEMLPKFDTNCGNKKSLSPDETYSHEEAPHLETHISLQEKPYQRSPSCCEIVNADQDHQETCVLPRGELDQSCWGDASSVLEYSGTMDTSTGDEGSEHKTPIYQKDSEVTYSLTDSEDHGDAMSPKGCQSSTPPYDHEISKAVLPLEVQCQNFQSRPEAAHENPDSMDSFAVCTEGYGSKSSMSADSTSGHQVVPDLLGMNSESRTSFVNNCSNECAANLSTYPLSSEKTLEQNVNRSEASAEMTKLQHDPGDGMKLLVTALRPQSAAAQLQIRSLSTRAADRLMQ